MSHPSRFGTASRGATLHKKRTAGEQTTLDTTALLIAKLLQRGDNMDYKGDATKLHETMDAIMQHPARVGGCALMLLNMIARMSDAYYPGGLQNLVDYYVTECVDYD